MCVVLQRYRVTSPRQRRAHTSSMRGDSVQAVLHRRGDTQQSIAASKERGGGRRCSRSRFADTRQLSAQSPRAVVAARFVRQSDKWRTQVCTLCEQVAAAQYSMLLRRHRLRVELTLVRVPPDVGRCRENPKPALRVGKRRLSINVRRARKFSEKLGTESSISNNTRAGQAAQCATPNG